VWLAAGLALGPMVALGFGRFSYALLLPPMRASLGWTYTQAGAMNTANGLGYLLGAVLVPGCWGAGGRGRPLRRRCSLRR
jgi:predicted MFS family arabinose efflux permease